MPEEWGYETFDVPNSTYRVITWEGQYIGMYDTMLDEVLEP